MNIERLSKWTKQHRNNKRSVFWMKLPSDLDHGALDVCVNRIIDAAQFTKTMKLKTKNKI
jgi:hypothetical protein